MAKTATATTSIDQAQADLAEHGVAIMAGALDPVATADVRARLVRAAERSEERGFPTRNYEFDPDGQNVRVFMLFNLDPIFAELIVHPLAMRLVHASIGEAFSISNFSANILGPGAGSMVLHADQGYATEPWPPVPLAVNVGWILDDFTEEVGATRYVPGSHLHGHNPEPGREYETVSIEAPAGSILAMDGRMWHQSGVNCSTDHHRAALFGYYVRSWIRPQVNWNAFLEPEVAASLSPEFLDLLGYRTGYVDLIGQNRRRAEAGAGATGRGPS
jgi:ectoine hydroxylase-related dioxygenase (phytanoyl-CoA dioxygenase family)